MDLSGDNGLLTENSRSYGFCLIFDGREARISGNLKRAKLTNHGGLTGKAKELGCANL